jgi:hypothetical protein
MSEQFQPYSMSEFIQAAERRLKQGIASAFGKEIMFLITSVLANDIDCSLKVEFTLPTCFGNSRFVWYFSTIALAKDIELHNQDTQA